MSLLLKNRGAMLLLMLNIFLAFTGIGLVVPIMPTYMNEPGHWRECGRTAGGSLLADAATGLALRRKTVG